MYGNVDPINHVDPSGYFSLGSLGAAGNIQATLGNLAVRTGYLLRAYNTAEAVKGFFDLAGAVRKVMGQASSFSVNPRSGIPDINMQDAIESASYNLPKAIAAGVYDWGKGFSSIVRKDGKKSLKSFLLYMPLLNSGVGGQVAIKTPAKITFANVKVPIKIVFGAKDPSASGTLFGLGVEMRGRRQLIRMDTHKFHGAGRSDITAWRDGDFHYHVQKWFKNGQ